MSIFHRKSKAEKEAAATARQQQVIADVISLYAQAEDESLISVNVGQRRILVAQTFAAKFTKSGEQLMNFFVGVGTYAYYRSLATVTTDAIAKRELDLLWKAKADKGADLTTEEATVCKMRAREGLNLQDVQTDASFDIVVIGWRNDPKVLAHWQDMKVEIVSVLEEEETDPEKEKVEGKSEQ